MISSAPIEQHALEVVSLLRPTVEVGLGVVSESLARPGASEFLTSLAHPQDLPLTIETLATWRNGEAEATVAGRPIFTQETDPVGLTAELWAVTNRILAPLLGGERTLLASQIGSGDANRFLVKMLPIVENGSLDKIAARVRDPHLRSALPLVLLRTASTALIEQTNNNLTAAERNLPEDTRINLVLSRAEARLKAMADSIVSGNKPGPQPKSKASTAEKVAWGSMEAMRRGAYINTDEIFETLLIVDLAVEFRNLAFREGKSLGGLDAIIERRPTADEARENIFFDMVEILPDAISRVAGQLATVGLSFGGLRQLVDQERVGRRVATPAVEVNRNASVRAEVLKDINNVHARLRMRQIIASVLGGIHSGEHAFMPIYHAGLLLSTPIMGNRAAVITAEREAEQLRLAQIHEEEMLAREAEIQEQLSAMGVNWLNKELFPAGDGQGSPRGTTQDRREETGHVERELDEYRLRALLHLQAITGGERWESSFRLKPGEKREKYHVLVFTIGDVTYALAECAEVNNAMYIWRSDMPHIKDWRLVFSQDKTSALASRALPLSHPRKEERLTDPAGSAIRFADRAFDIATTDINEFVRLWLRASASAKGKIATVATLETN